MCTLSGQPQKMWKRKEEQVFGVSYEFLCLAYETFLSPTCISLCRFSHKTSHKKTFLNSHVRKNISLSLSRSGSVDPMPLFMLSLHCFPFPWANLSFFFFFFLCFSFWVTPLGRALPRGNPQATWSSSVVLVSFDSDSLVQTSYFPH